MLTWEAAYKALERYTAELSPEDRATLLEEHTTARTVAAESVQLHDPYSAAVAHLMHPATVKARTQGSVSETYIDPAQVAAYLQEASRGLRATWPLADGPATVPLDLRLTIEGW